MIDQIKSKLASTGKQGSSDVSKQAKEVVQAKSVAQSSAQKSSESTSKSNISKFITKDMILIFIDGSQSQ